MLMHLSNTLPVLAFFQLGASQLNTFETFLNNAVHGIQGMGIISGMMNVAYAILLAGFLWELYQTALHGGDVKGLGKAAVKYLATALVVQAWPDVFIQVNTAFVHAGQWMTNAGGVSNVLDTWQLQLGTEFQQEGVQHMWNLITGEIAGLLDAILIFIAYLLYPIATLIFGFFYMLMGSILFIFGPIVISSDQPAGKVLYRTHLYLELLAIALRWSWAAHQRNSYQQYANPSLKPEFSRWSSGNGRRVDGRVDQHRLFRRHRGDSIYGEEHRDGRCRFGGAAYAQRGHHGCHGGSRGGGGCGSRTQRGQGWRGWRRQLRECCQCGQSRGNEKLSVPRRQQPARAPAAAPGAECERALELCAEQLE